MAEAPTTQDPTPALAEMIATVGAVNTRAYPLLATWFTDARRPLPWRTPGTSAWGILISEVMAQQTPVSRVAEPWQRWMTLWPTPGDLNAANSAEVLREWGNLGYPRRALRLQECARTLVDHHAGQVPADETALRALPGIGEYTAAAICAFAFGLRTVVLDTNIRRVLGRAFSARAAPATHLTVAERHAAAALVPENRTESVIWNEALMELGALVCTPRNPRCAECPLTRLCTWKRAGYPDHGARVARPQAFHGTDRQIRGRIMAHLRQNSPASQAALHEASGTARERFTRVLSTLVTDGLAHFVKPDLVALGPAPVEELSSSPAADTSAP